MIFKNSIKKTDNTESIKNNKKLIRIALAGNPNSGKTSIFNALTGETQHVGNYPGVTVEKKVGRINYKGRIIEFIDLPGTYSLSAFSIEEVVTRDFVIKEKPDVIIDVIDSTNVERNLYLCLQFQELGVPIVGALNMTDEAQTMGININEKQLGTILGIPFVKTIGSRGKGTEELLSISVQVADGIISSNIRHLNYGQELETQHNKLIDILQTDPIFKKKYSLHWTAIKLLENDNDAIKKITHEHRNSTEIINAAAKARLWVEKHFGDDSEVVVGEQRYAYIHGACREVITDEQKSKRIDYTEIVDNVILNKYLGLVIFLGVMFLIYHLTFTLGNPLSGIINNFFNWGQENINQYLPHGILKDLLVEGIIGGVGGVLMFLPIVLLLFLGLSLLEDTGYMARAAFVMDKLMHIFGLHGRSFIPMMVSTGCAVPGVMSARTLVNPKDRVLTILIAPLMMCGAKTPVIAMLTAAFFPDNAGPVFWSIWFFSWVLALIIAKFFRNTIYKGETSPFVMELPPYRMPTVMGVVTHVWEKSWSYLKKAGTFILAASMIIWFILYFPKPKHYTKNYKMLRQELKLDYEKQLKTGLQPAAKAALYKEYQAKSNKLNLQNASEELNYSLGGRIGKLIEPIFKPCGFDWRIDIALFAGFTAKEVIISTMGIVYGIGEADIENEANSYTSVSLKDKLKEDPNYNSRNMLALMVFILVYIPCMATLAVVKKELGKWKYPVFLAGYTLVTAWVLATLIYQVSGIMGYGG